MSGAHGKENVTPQQRSQFDELQAYLPLDFLNIKMPLFSTPCVTISHILATSWEFLIIGFI